jgi:hypothetical protein
MRETYSTQTSFTSGEIDPRLKARIEVARYYAGAAELRNVLVRPAGGVIRRPGMRHCEVLSGGADGVRLVPFAFNVEQTYAIAFHGGSFTVFRSDGQQVASFGGAPWTAAQAAQFGFAQSADTLLLFHPDMAPQQLRRGASDALWTLGGVPWTNIPTFDFGLGAEPMMSATRGWPSCGTFHDGRLWIGGFRSRPATLLGSTVGLFFDFDPGTGLDDQAINVTIQSDQVNAVHALRSGRNLQVFTSGAEFAITVTPPITPTNVAIEEQSRRGIKRFSNVVEVDGASLFIQNGGAAVRQFIYQEVEQAYRADLLSLLAPHLIKDPIELAARKGASNDDADHVLMVNPDGSVTVLTTLRSQEIAAFTRWDTAGGLIRSACALASGQVFFAVNRSGQVSVETWDATHLLDASRRQVVPGGVAFIGSLAHLEGRTVAVVADNAFLGTFTVTGGAVTLPRTAVFAEAGLVPDLAVRTLPFEPRAPTGALIGRKARIMDITARVHGTGQFRVQRRPVIHRAFGLAPGTPLDTPPPIVTADVEMRGLAGWSERIEVAIDQPAPAPFHLLALAFKAMVET